LNTSLRTPALETGLIAARGADRNLLSEINFRAPHLLSKVEIPQILLPSRWAAAGCTVGQDCGGSRF